MDSMLEIHKLRQADFAMFVTNNARAQAFQMAKDCYEVHKDTPEAAHWKKAMSDIVTAATPNDELNAAADGANLENQYAA